MKKILTTHLLIQILLIVYSFLYGKIVHLFFHISTIHAQITLKSIIISTIVGPLFLLFLTYITFNNISKLIKDCKLLILISSVFYSIIFISNINFVIYYFIFGLIINSYYCYLKKENVNPLFYSFFLLTLTSLLALIY